MTAARGGWTVESVEPADGAGPVVDGVLAVAAASFPDDWPRSAFRRDLDRDFARLFVVRGPAGEVAGYCATWLVGDELQIHSLAVGPLHRRRGAARALLAHALDAARRRGARAATLEVRRSNRAAQRLYRAAGFAVRAVHPRAYRRPVEDALILHLALAPAGAGPS